jgi:serine/threonine protein kinase
VEAKIAEYKSDRESSRLKIKLILKHKEFRLSCVSLNQRLDDICKYLHLSAAMHSMSSVTLPVKAEFFHLQEDLQACMAESTTTRAERAEAHKALTILRVQGEDVLNYNEIDINDVEIDDLKLLGEGAFADVFEGTYNGNDVAVKKLKMIGGKERLKLALKMAQRELEQLSQLKHENILTIIGGCTILSNKFFIITERALCSLRDLLDTESLISTVKVRLLLDAAQAMEFLHNEHNMLHCDNKPANMLIFEGYRLKVADIGLAKIRDKTGTSTELCLGTVKYMAPETFAPEAKFTTATDIYSYAVLVNEVCSGEVPWDGDDVSFIRMQVVAGDRRAVVLTADLEPLRIGITRGWAQDASQRPNFTTICQSLRALQRSLESNDGTQHSAEERLPELTTISSTTTSSADSYTYVRDYTPELGSSSSNISSVGTSLEVTS